MCVHVISQVLRLECKENMRIIYVPLIFLFGSIKIKPLLYKRF